MNSEVKKLWLEALRSGKYKQGQNYLKVQDKFCCLGVLCDLYPGRVWKQSDNETETGERCYIGIYEQSKFDLPQQVREWAGIESTNCTIPTRIPFKDAELNNLVALNDVAKYTFTQIADVIEEQL